MNPSRLGPGSISEGRAMMIVIMIALGFLLTRCLSSCAYRSATVEVRDGKRVTRVRIPQQSIFSFTLSAAGGMP